MARPKGSSRFKNEEDMLKITERDKLCNHNGESAIGKEIHGLTILGIHSIRLQGSRRTQVWRCMCSCGKEITRTSSYVVRRRTDSCICDKKHFEAICRNSREFHNLKKSGKLPDLYSYVNRLKSHAEKIGREFSISYEYVSNLFEEQNGLCALTGVKIEKPAFAGARCAKLKDPGSLDRIDSSIGYVEGNVQWVHKVVNVMKLHHPQEEFIKWCKLVAEYNK